jgi:hypothetical protein
VSEHPLTEFLREVGDRPYRELVQHHIRKTGTRKLKQAVLGESQSLPQQLQVRIIDYIDETNARFAYDQAFWAQATCRHAFEQIIDAAIHVLPLRGIIESIDDALKPRNQELAFQLFQISTLSFAYSASTQRQQRKFMGIRKGFFG